MLKFSKWSDSFSLFGYTLHVQMLTWRDIACLEFFGWQKFDIIWCHFAAYPNYFKSKVQYRIKLGKLSCPTSPKRTLTQNCRVNIRPTTKTKQLLNHWLISVDQSACQHQPHQPLSIISKTKKSLHRYKVPSWQECSSCGLIDWV